MSLPICPHCNAKIGTVNETTQRKGWSLHITRIYSCPSCNKILGVGAHV